MPVSALREGPGVARRARVLLNSEVLAAYLRPDGAQDREAHQALFAACPEETADALRALGVEGLNAPYRYMPPALIAALRSRGVALSLWTVDGEEDLRRLLAEDLLNITTRSVRTALRLRGVRA